MRRSVTDRLLAAAVDWLAPPICLGCGGLGGGRLSLCAACVERLVGWPPGCARCGRPLAVAHPPSAWACAGCRVRPPPFERLVAVWVYRPPLDAVIHGLKYRRLEYLGGHLADAIWERLPVLPAADLVVAVPLHWRRRLARGFNQAASIARPLARRLDIPVAAALVRRRATPPQARLSRRRRLLGPRGAFRARRGVPVAGRRVLLVDDVMTTGATLCAAADSLRAAGAASVTALVAARTPEPGCEADP